MFQTSRIWTFNVRAVFLNHNQNLHFIVWCSICSGGTVDITVHEVMVGGTLRELHKASGGAWGGTKVDESFRQFLIKLVGKLFLFYLFYNLFVCKKDR